MKMGILSAALTDERWEEAALCLLIGLLQAGSRVPADALLGLLEALEGEANGEE